MALSVSIVLPLLLLMAFGYFTKRIHIVDEAVMRKMNRFGMRCFLPVNLFYNIYRSDFSSVFQPRLVLFACGGILCVYLLLCLVVPRLVQAPPDRGSIIQGIYRSNYVLFGVTIVTATYGMEQSGIPAVLSAFVVPLFNVLAVLTFELFRGGRPKLSHLLLGIARNPLIGGSVLGLACNGLHLVLPPVLEQVIAQISGVASPFLLIVLGGTFTFRSLKHSVKPLFWVCLFRLFLVPGLMLPLAFWAGFRGIELMTLLVVFASPTAISSYAMAEELGGNGMLSNQIVVTTSTFSMLSIFLWVSLFSAFSWI